MKTIGLCVIVKNESRVILRCLESVRPLVDYVVIEDTGSTDGTQDIIRRYLEREGLPGEVFEEPWRDFAHNRSVALARMRQRGEIDYALMMDADDTLELGPGFDAGSFKERLVLDCYDVKMQRFSVEFFRTQICSNRKPFRYRGVLHEVLVGPSRLSTGIADGVRIRYGQEGSRGQDADKYSKDAQVLERALRSERDPWLRSRYTFYLAQSYFGLRDPGRALQRYVERTKQGFWEEEIDWSYYRAAGLKLALGQPLDEALRAFAKASEICPGRAEALHEASRLCRESGRFAEGYELAKRGLAIRRPDKGLFTEPWVYEYGLLDEFAVNAYWAGRYDDCLHACERLLEEGRCPKDMRPRVAANAEFARKQLALQA